MTVTENMFIVRGGAAGGPAERDRPCHKERSGRGSWGRSLPPIYKVNGGREASRWQAEVWLSPLQSHLAGLGHISEILEGDPPHRPCGCIAQAWSVAEVLRAYVEDAKGILPAAHPEGRPSHTKDRSAVQSASVS